MALIILAALIVAAGVASIIVAATRSHHTASAAPHGEAAAGTASASAQATVSSSASAQPSPAGTAAALPAFGLVGGGGVTPRAAAGKLGVADSVGDVLFAEDGTGLDHNARTVVASAAQAIRDHHPATVTVIGYTDAIGNARANNRLSLERARAVISALRAKVGGSAATYRPKARAQGKPIASKFHGRRAAAEPPRRHHDLLTGGPRAGLPTTAPKGVSR